MVSVNYTRAKDKLAVMVVEFLRQETIEEGGAKTKDIYQIFHCLVPTRYFLGRIAWHSGFQTDREIETSTCDRCPVRSPDRITVENHKWPSGRIIILYVINVATPQGNKKLTYIKPEQMHGVRRKTFWDRDGL